jgi:hypothetical protein
VQFRDRRQAAVADDDAAHFEDCWHRLAASTVAPAQTVPSAVRTKDLPESPPRPLQPDPATASTSEARRPCGACRRSARRGPANDTAAARAIDARAPFFARGRRGLRAGRP